MKLNTYLHFNGNCEQALKFYEKAFGGKLAFLIRYGEAPGDEPCSKELANKVMHGRVVFGDNVVMASDCPPERFTPPGGFSINVDVATPAEAERIFAALSENANVGMPMEETFWAKRFGMLNDQFGVPWMVNCEKKA